MTVTALDGLVLARSAFNSSMNYRCGVVIGPARLVDDPQEKARALDLIVEHVVPGHAAALRPNTRKELAATSVLAVPLHEASLKTRAGGPDDDQPDIDAGYWAGHAAPADGRLRGRARPGRTRARARARPAPGRGSGCASGSSRVAAMTTGELTLVLLKPDAVRRGLVGEILGRFEAKGLTHRGDGAPHHQRVDRRRPLRRARRARTSTPRCATS